MNPSLTRSTALDRGKRSRLAPALAACVVLAGSAPAAPMTVYDDALRNSFQDWSWAEHDLQATAYVHTGSYAISMVPVSWEGLYFHRSGIDVAANGTLELWVHGGAAGGQQIRFHIYANQQALADAELEPFVEGGAIPAGQWARATIPFSALGVTGGSVDGFVFQADAAALQPVVYFDDLVLLDTSGPPQPITVSVDPAADRRSISPLIYGVNLGDSLQFAALPFPLRRWGGNATTRYNWEKDATNHASDWFFINLPESPDSAGLPDDSSADRWIEATLGAGAEAAVTVPTIGWTARDRAKRWGFSIEKYGPQQENECSATGWPPWCSADAGNGVRLDGTPVTGNDPHDTSIEVGAPFAVGWLQHIISRVGGAQSGGVRYYALDNEPALWNSTHRDVHPEPVDLDELWDRSRTYAEAIHATDPGAEVLGPAAWGWCEYFYSAADGCQPGPDMAGHGGLPLLEWYLAQNRARELETGTRPIDVLDVHYYPQAENVALTDDEAVAAVRLRSLRSLYDPDYVDESWIGQPVRLIPRLREWIAARCPGMRIALTEYNWGGDQGISSALAQAEALAIFGREGIDLAARWVAPQASSKVLEAFRLYLDYDGAGSDLMGESVRAQSSNVDAVGAYAILLEGDERTGVLLFNKGTGERAVQVAVAGALDGPAPVHRFDAAISLGPSGEVEVASGAFEITLPARSATLVLVPVLDAASAGGSAGEAARGLRSLRLRPEPNPSHSAVRIRFLAPRSAEVRAEILDATGRLVRTCASRPASDAGRPDAMEWRSIVWDGRDRSGSPAPSGVYFVRARAGNLAETTRILRIE